MIQFGSLDYAELRFHQMRATVEIRDKQWIDVELHLELEEGMVLPDDFTELTALIFCTYAGKLRKLCHRMKDETVNTNSQLMRRHSLSIIMNRTSSRSCCRW